MSLLCARIDTNIIQMVGCWHSDTKFLYLHLQAMPLIGNLARILTAGAFTLLPNTNILPQAA